MQRRRKLQEGARDPPKDSGDKHPDTASVAFLLAKSLISQKKHEEALRPLEEAASIWKATEQLVDAAWMHSWRGDSLAALNRKPEAATAYTAGLAEFRELAHADGEATILKRLADLDGSADLKVERDRLWKEALTARDEGRLNDAVLLGERVLAIETVWLGDGSPEITQLLTWLAEIEDQRENWPQQLREESRFWIAFPVRRVTRSGRLSMPN